MGVSEEEGGRERGRRVGGRGEGGGMEGKGGRGRVKCEGFGRKERSMRGQGKASCGWTSWLVVGAGLELVVGE